MRARSAILVSAVSLFVVACSFGVDLDNLFDGTPAGNTDGSLDGQAGDGATPLADAAIPKAKVVELQAGSDFACGRRIDGTVMCWGYNDSYGQLGNGAPQSSSVPVLVKDLKDAVSLGVGSLHACIVHKTGTVSCWGRNDERQLGDGTKNGSPVPVDVVQLSGAVTVAVGNAFSCALRTDGSVWCWGDDTIGQLGDNMMTTRSQAAAVSGLANATQLVASSGTACARVKTGDVYCWGANDSGQAGQSGGMMPPPILTATKVAGLSGIKTIGSGSQGNHFCAVDGSGGIKCWGDGGSGQLGNSTTNDSSMPVQVASIDDGVGVTAGGGFTCAWRKSGAINCWGTNGWRELGVGDTMPPGSTSTPLPVVGISNVVAAAAGGSFTCALMNDGDNVSCWGSNFAGSLGRATLINSATPVTVMTAGPSSAIATGAEHACAVSSTGTVSCWGMNDLSQLGTNTILGSGTPIGVAPLTGASQVAAGGNHSCALLGTQVQCWGHAQYGELGDGKEPYIAIPPVIFGASPITAVGAGDDFTCGILSNGQITCTGSGYHDVIGRSGGQIDSPQSILNPPVYVDAGPDAEAGAPTQTAYGPVSSIAIGPLHSCLIHGGVMACWGYSGYGECGSTVYAQTLPNDITLPATPISVAAGGSHSCAALMDGTVRCLGANGRSQLGGAGGDGSQLRQPNLGSKLAKTVATGESHSCALTTDGAVLCWGAGTAGQIGNGVLSDTPTPTAVTGLSNITAISARGDFTCALSKAGVVSCWGNNESAQLGNGTVLSTGTPAAVAGY